MQNNNLDITQILYDAYFGNFDDKQNAKYRNHK